MKAVFIVCVLLSSAWAAPKFSKLGFRDVYKNPVDANEIKPGPRIIGGRQATPHSFPYQAFLTSYSSCSVWYCGGTLISQNYILTVVKCVQDTNRIEVILGAHRPLVEEDSQIRLTSTEYKIHEDFDADNFLNDVALIRLPKSVHLTVAIQPIFLPTDINNDYNRALSTISGWGSTTDTEPLDVLNFGQLEVISNTECASYYTTTTITSSFLCTSVANGTVACTGDRGTPLVTDGVLIGLSCFVASTGCLEAPSGYTRITTFLDWIHAHSDA